jgi:HlyD family secretion protein
VKITGHFSTTINTVQNGRAKLVPVTIGRMNDEQAELLGGLKKGAVVILHPSEKISDDARVKAR